jgi:ribosomal protein L31E
MDDFGPQVLSFEELKICFLVCLSPLSLALITFVVEVLWSQFKNGCFARVEIVKKVLIEKRKRNEIAIKNFLCKKLKKKNCEHFPIRPRSKTCKAIEDKLFNATKSLTSKFKEFKPKHKTFSENQKNFRIKVKLSEFDFLNRFKDFSLRKKLSECFSKKKTAAVPVTKLPTIIQVKPKISDPFDLRIISIKQK